MSNDRTPTSQIDNQLQHAESGNHGAPPTLDDKYSSDRPLTLAEFAAGFRGKPVTVVLPLRVVATAGDPHGTDNPQVVDRPLTVAEGVAGLIRGTKFVVEKRDGHARIVVDRPLTVAEAAAGHIRGAEVFVEKRGRRVRIADC
jgi:hypothetical protein